MGPLTVGGTRGKVLNLRKAANAAASRGVEERSASPEVPSGSLNSVDVDDILDEEDVDEDDDRGTLDSVGTVGVGV